MTSCQHFICYSCIQELFNSSSFYHTIYPENFEVLINNRRLAQGILKKMLGINEDKVQEIFTARVCGVAIG